MEYGDIKSGKWNFSQRSMYLDKKDDDANKN